MLHLPAAILRMRDDKLPFSSPSRRTATVSPADDLVWLIATSDTGSTREKCLVYAEHEILIFLYFEAAAFRFSVRR
jgi:hypothetical protein